MFDSRHPMPRATQAVAAGLLALGLATHAYAVSLTINSDYPAGVHSPATGSTALGEGDILTLSVLNSPDMLSSTHRVLCTGWQGSGDVPESGTATTTGPITFTHDSSIAWQWQTQVWVSVGIDGAGATSEASGWRNAGETLSITASADEHCAFLGWSGETNGTTISGTTLQFLVGASRAVTATFNGGPWAYHVVDYTPGDTIDRTWGDNIPFTNTTAVIGAPQRRDAWGTDFNPFYGPYALDQICSIGAGGELVLAFDHAVSNDVDNPYGADFIIFGNTFFSNDQYSPDAADDIIGADPGEIRVSQDGSNWVQVVGLSADTAFPSMGYENTVTGSYYDPAWGTTFWSFYGGTQPTDFLKPVDPAATWLGKGLVELQAIYDGSGGGTPVDFGATGLAWIRYVKISQPTNDWWATDIHALADVEPIRSVSLNVQAGVGGTVSAAGGTYAFGDEVSVTALPSDLYRFSAWSGQSQGDVSNATMTVRMTRDRQLSASFAELLAVNGVPKIWLKSYGLTNALDPTFDLAALADRDLDGMDAWAEYYAGTDPTDIGSVFRILQIGAEGASNRVVWLGGTTGSSRPFIVKGATNAVGPWVALDSQVSRSPDGTNAWWHAGGPAPVGFYRISVNTD